jgi:hypothetical protein
LPIVIAFVMPAAIVCTGAAFVPGLLSLPVSADTNVPRPLQPSSSCASQLLSTRSPQISFAPGRLSGSESSQSPAHVLTPS